MEAFQKRMVNEYKEIRGRIEALDRFIYSDPRFDRLDNKEKYLLVQQITGMKVYLTSLMSRLNHQGITIEIP